MKKFRLLSTDQYQLTMGAAYLLLDQHNDKVGFEAFYRRANPKMNADDDRYIFDGGTQVRDLLNVVREELEDPELIETFLTMVKPGFPEDKRDEYEATIRERWKTLETEFACDVYPNKCIIRPFVPAVQFYGAKLIGQLLETPTLNIINGQTGYTSKSGICGDVDDLHLFETVREVSRQSTVTDLRKALDTRAKEYREATSKILMDASFRRSPSYSYALWASEIAINNGWNGTSNTSVLFDTNIGRDKVGGTMAHSFIMSQPDELAAFMLWDSIYPNSTILIDTYDIKNALHLLVDNDIKPAVVRIDSEPLDQWAIYTRAFLDSKGWNDVKIFISGDLTPERLMDYEERGVPFDMCMAGTEYANVGDVGDINAGFVYKLVQFEAGGEVFYPQKKSKGKGSIGGLKLVVYDKHTQTISAGVRKSAFGFAFDTELTYEVKDVIMEV